MWGAAEKAAYYATASNDANNTNDGTPTYTPPTYTYTPPTYNYTPPTYSYTPPVYTPPSNTTNGLLSISATTIGATSGRVGGSTFDELAYINFTANQGAPVLLNSLALTISGDALKDVIAFSPVLIDPNTNAAVSGIAIPTCYVSNLSCRAVFGNLNTFISAGTTK